MIVQPHTAVTEEAVEHPDAQGVTIRWLIGENSPAPVFWMRQFEIQPGGHTPLHSHPWEHEVYILSGEGRLNSDSGFTPVQTGYFALVMPGEIHQFENTGMTPLRFLCMIPRDEK